MERSYVNQLAPAKKGGFMLHGVLENGVTYAGSVYQQNTFGETDQDSTGKGFAGRATVNLAQFFGNKDVVVHAGLSGFDSEYGVQPTTSSSPKTTTAAEGNAATNGTIFSIRTEGRGLANVYRAQVTGTPIAAEKGTSSLLSNSTSKVNNSAYGLEMALAYGPFKVQGEYTDQRFKAKNDVNSGYFNADVSAGYVEALFMLTGENYADWYKNGAWGGIKPKREFDIEKGTGLGAWEIGLRYDTFNAGDVTKDAIASSGSRCQGSVTAACDASIKTYTAGIKWQLNPNMRVLANYSHTKFGTRFTPVDLATTNLIDSEDIYMVRTQFNF